MIKVFVDSGSSIKQSEKEKFDVEIFPLKILLGDKEYLDGIDLSMDIFYDALINQNLFPKTSLPSIGEAEKLVKSCTENGDDVIILTISSGISGTYNAFKQFFASEPKVRVIDSKTAVGGMRILVNEINKYRDRSLDFVEEKLMALIPKIKVIAVPETLDYLQKGGRLSRSAWAVGSLLQLKPLISLDSIDGSVKVLGKAMGKRRAMEAVAKALVDFDCDENYEIVPSYTYDEKNLDQLIAMTDEKYHAQMTDYDNLDPAIACHWGPSAYGYIFVSKK